MSDALCLEAVEAELDGRRVLHGVSLVARHGEVVSLLGLNGAGKSVLGRTVSGLVPASAGRVLVEGRDVTRSSPRRRVRLGLHHLSQRRGLVPELSVVDNLRLAAHAAGRRFDEASVHQHPLVGPLAGQRAGTLSGGEQSIVALARAELADPTVLVADEPTAGLASGATTVPAQVLRRIADSGACVVLIEQHVPFALEIADRVVVLRRGSVTLDSPTPKVTARGLRSALVG